MFNKTRVLAFILTMAFTASAYSAFTSAPPMSVEAIRVEVQAQQAAGLSFQAIAQAGVTAGVSVADLTQGMLLATSTANAQAVIEALFRVPGISVADVVLGAVTAGASNTLITNAAANVPGISLADVNAAITSSRSRFAATDSRSTATGSPGGTTVSQSKP